MLTIEKLKKLDLNEKPVLIDENGVENLFLGFTSNRNVLVRDASDNVCYDYSLSFVSDWKIKGEKEPRLLYKWRLYYEDGNVEDMIFLFCDKGYYGDGKRCSLWHEAIKREKISEGVPWEKVREINDDRRR